MLTPMRFFSFPFHRYTLLWCALFIGVHMFDFHTAQAQIVTNSQALNQLGEAPKPKPSSKETPKKQHDHVVSSLSHHNTQQHHPPVQKTTTPSSTASAASIPLEPPPLPTLTPILPPVETHSFPLPPLPPIVKNALGTVHVLPNGICLTFAPNSDHLNPQTHQALLNFVKNLPNSQRIVIDAYSSGDKSDPSLPRRMAFVRALAARSVFMHAGIPSTRINVHVIGIPNSQTNTQPNIPPDHIDIYSTENFVP